MEISASGSLSDGKYEKGSFSEVQVINNFTGASPSNCGPGSSATQIVCTVDLSGLPLIQLPKKQFNISATQTINLPSGEFQIKAGYSYVGKLGRASDRERGWQDGEIWVFAGY